MKKYVSLVLDHDDTAVMSTPEIHYPAFLETLAVLRPGMYVSQSDFIKYNFDPGFYGMCRQIYNFTDEEMVREQKMWLDYVHLHIPDFYPGIPEIIRRQKAEGGIFCVVSHSFSDIIKRDYAAANLPMPDMIFGCELDEPFRKPNPYPIAKIAEAFDITPSDILVVDDLKPGYDMAIAAGADFAFAGWSSSRIPEIEAFMKSNGARILETPKELSDILFGVHSKSFTE